MSNLPKFTVVLACYQTEPYLPAALESISRQTFSDFEAICFVEESTDKSLEICQAMAKRDSRFKVVTAPKSGAVSSTRNYGINHAKGEYLVVIDGDDWVSVEMLEKLSMKLQTTGPVDVLSFMGVTTTKDTVDWDKDKKITNFRANDADGVFTGLEAIRRVGRFGGSINNYTWLCIYRVAFLREHNLYQTPGLTMEDLESTPRIWFFAKTFAYLNEAFYVYRRRPNSMTTEDSPRLVIDCARQIKSLMDFIKKNTIPEDIFSIWSNQWLTVLYWFMYHPVSSRKITNEDRKQVLDILFENGVKGKFKQIVSRASLPKRVSWPMILLASKGIYFPANFFFRQLYYPLVERRVRN